MMSDNKKSENDIVYLDLTTIPFGISDKAYVQNVTIGGNVTLTAFLNAIVTTGNHAQLKGFSGNLRIGFDQSTDLSKFLDLSFSLYLVIVGHSAWSDGGYTVSSTEKAAIDSVVGNPMIAPIRIGTCMKPFVVNHNGTNYMGIWNLPFSYKVPLNSKKKKNVRISSALASMLHYSTIPINASLCLVSSHPSGGTLSLEYSGNMAYSWTNTEDASIIIENLM